MKKIWWYPPGDFDWLSRAAKQAVREGLQKALALPDADQPAGLGIPGRVDPARSEIEGRLDAIKRRSALTRTTFNTNVGVIPPGLTSVPPHRAGPLALGAGTLPVPPSSQKVVKKEPIHVESSGDEALGAKAKVKKPKKLGIALAEAVIARQGKTQAASSSQLGQQDPPVKKKKKKKKEKKSKKRASSSSEDSGEEESSEDSVMPPLKKKAKESPGSVFKMPEAQAVEALAQDGVLEEEYQVGTGAGQRPKMHTYFQLALKPLLDQKSRDCREFAVVARALDLLREGRLEELADLLAGRMIALDTAAKQGWQTARHF